MYLLGFLALLAIVIIHIFNRLVTLRNQVKNAFSQIDVQLKRRYDLIPNLIEAVKGFMKHEQSTLQTVIEARNQAVSARESAAAQPLNPARIDQLSQADAVLGGTLGKLFALVESYPDLKSQTSMNDLMEELRTTENRIAFARQHFNDMVTEYNTARETFPNNLLAAGFGHMEAHTWKIENETHRENVKVSF